jgi:RNA polymerase-binding transcription factor DksA
MKDRKDHLIKRREELADRMYRLEQDARRAAEPLVADFADQAAQRENDEVIDRLREVTAAELLAISNALSRIGKGTYETCTACGRPIEPARFEALPATSHCRACEADRPQ